LDDQGNWSFEELATFNMTDNIIPVAIAGNDQIITLPNNTVTLDGSSSNDPDGSISTYHWTKISGPPSGTILSQHQSITQITGLVEGHYQFELEVIDDEGVADLDTIDVTVNNESCPSMPTIIQDGNVLSVNDNISTYQWFMNDVAVNGATNKTLEISILEYGVYAVEITSNGCTVRSADYVYLITSAKGEHAVYKIFPNPTDTKFYISVSGAKQNTHLIIVDALGRSILSMDLRAGLNLIEDDVLAQGIYYVMIDGRPGEKIEKR
jgi:hypothetical protein